MGDVLAVLPFQNTLSTFNITGAGIVAALENGVSQVEEGGGRFPQVAGLRFTWDPKVAAERGPDQDGRGAGGRGLGADRPGQGLHRSRPTTSCATAATATRCCATRATNAYDFGPGPRGRAGDYLAEHPDYSTAPQGRITRVE